MKSIGVNKYQEEFYLGVSASKIFKKAKEWLERNEFRIKTEIPETYINSYAGWDAFFWTDRQTRRWLEIQIRPHRGMQKVILSEKVRFLAWMFGSLIKEEVIQLATFLKTCFPENVMEAQGSKYCIHCGTPLPSDATYCAACGKKLEL